MKERMKVVDEYGAEHTLTRCLGRGGQGEVWLEGGGRRIVKLVHGCNPEQVRRQFLFVRRLALAGMHVARPLAVLKPPHVGYVAEFLGGMEPILRLREAAIKEGIAGHIRTGSLRRRLRLLAHAGEALAGLHSIGVAYGDVSDRNVFVSEPVHANEAWLIDLDNLTHEADPKRAIYTPGFGAPEIVAGRSGSTSLSDAFSFAVLVWQALTLGHPFVGDAVDGGDPELEQKAFAGALPWVGHSKDESNRCRTGLPAEDVLSRRLQDLTRTTFETNLHDWHQRPGVAGWVENLHYAADRTVSCPGCKGTYLANRPNCTWCDEPRPHAEPVQIQRWDPEDGYLVPASDPIGSLALTAEGLQLPRRLTLLDVGRTRRDVHVELRLVDKRGIGIRVAAGSEAWVAQVGGDITKAHPVEDRERIVQARGWILFFERPDRPQRVAILGRDA